MASMMMERVGNRSAVMQKNVWNDEVHARYTFISLCTLSVLSQFDMTNYVVTAALR